MPTAISINSGLGFYEKTILSLLSNMKLGRLNITLPNGESVALGEGGHSITANITVKDKEFFKRCVLFGDIGFGESYVDGLWETDNITNVINGSF